MSKELKEKQIRKKYGKDTLALAALRIVMKLDFVEDCSLLRDYSCGEPGTILLDILQEAAPSLESKELARALREAYRKSNPAMEFLFKMVVKKASYKALPILEKLQKDIEKDHAWSAKADARKAFAKEYGKELEEFISKLRSQYQKGSLFEEQMAFS